MYQPNDKLRHLALQYKELFGASPECHYEIQYETISQEQFERLVEDAIKKKTDLVTLLRDEKYAHKMLQSDALR